MTFGSWLGDELARRGWTMKRLARTIDVDDSTVRRWVKGTNEPGYSEIVKVIDALGASPFTPSGSHIRDYGNPSLYLYGTEGHRPVEVEHPPLEASSHLRLSRKAS